MLAPDTASARWFHTLAAPEKRVRIWLVWPVAIATVLLAVAFFLDEPVSLALEDGLLGQPAFYRYFTVLGRSDWLLIPSLIGGASCLLLMRLPLAYSWRWAARGLWWLSGYVFVSIAFSGIVVVILKRLIGRARPMYMDELGVFDFTPFEIVDWSLHSFPSGHATTAFAFVVVMMTLLHRRFAWAFFALGVMICVSRIVLGDHFLSDVIAGSFVGFGCALLVRDWFATNRWSMRLEKGEVRYRYSPFMPLWRRLRRGQIPALLK